MLIQYTLKHVLILKQTKNNKKKHRNSKFKLSKKKTSDLDIMCNLLNLNKI